MEKYKGVKGVENAVGAKNKLSKVMLVAVSMLAVSPQADAKDLAFQDTVVRSLQTAAKKAAQEGGQATMYIDSNSKLVEGSTANLMELGSFLGSIGVRNCFAGAYNKRYRLNPAEGELDKLFAGIKKRQARTKMKYSGVKSLTEKDMKALGASITAVSVDCMKHSVDSVEVKLPSGESYNFVLK